MRHGPFNFPNSANSRGNILPLAMAKQRNVAVAVAVSVAVAGTIQ